MRRACVIALLPLLLASARADDKPDLQTILDAWKAREKATNSFDFRWWIFLSVLLLVIGAWNVPLSADESQTKAAEVIRAGIEQWEHDVEYVGNFESIAGQSSTLDKAEVGNFDLSQFPRLTANGIVAKRGSLLRFQRQYASGPLRKPAAWGKSRYCYIAKHSLRRSVRRAVAASLRTGGKGLWGRYLCNAPRS